MSRRSLGLLAVVAAWWMVALPSAATTYYVSPTGNDKNTGTSPSAPLKSINTAIGKAVAGDTLYLVDGSVFTEDVYFGPGSGGSSGSPKTLTTSSSNPATVKPTATGSTGCYIYNAGYITVSYLKFVGAGMDSSTKDGVMAYADNAAYSGLSFLNLDVSGFGAAGIVIGGWNGTTCGFQNVLIQDCRSHDNRKAGITSWGQYPTSNQNLTVRRCTVYNNLGDPAATSHTGSGIVLGNLTGGLIEHCIAYDNGSRCTTTGGPVGIWAWDASNVTIQFCEAYRNRAVNCDGGGFDLDGGCQGCIIQYCYSHDNDGPGYLICQYSGARAFTNNTVRYNISENDGRRNVCGIQFWSAGSNGGIQSTRVYGNAVYNAYAPAVWYASGGISGCTMWNNILVTANGKAIVSGSPATSAIVFQGNLYWASGSTVSIAGYSSLDAWRTATGQEKVGGNAAGMLVNPLLTNPGAGVTIGDTSKLDTLAGYKLQAGSPCIDAGLNLQSLFSIDPGTRDYYGNTLPQGAALDIGAHECPPSLPAAPSGLAAAAVSSSTINLAWTDNASSETGFEIERAVGVGSFAALATVGAGVTTYVNDFLDDATLYTYRVRAVNASGSSAWSNSSGATTLAAGALPSPWETADIGSCGMAGNAGWRANVFTGWGSGADIWGTADAFRFVYRPLTSDGEIRARVLGVENTNAWAKAGVMVRQTLDAGSAHAMMALAPGNGLAFQRRTAAGGTSVTTSGGAATAPRWVRIVRAGSMLTGATSTDGTTWTTVGTETIVMADPVYVGLAVTSHDNTQRCTARFDSVELIRTPVEATVTLAGGYTLIALPLEPGSPFTAESLAQHVAAHSTPPVLVTGVIEYPNSFTGEANFNTHPVGSSVNNFAIVPGRGYFLRCSGAGTWTLTGYRLGTPAVTLQAGYNLVGLPKQATGYTSESASAEANSQPGGSVTQVVRYDVLQAQFRTHPTGTSVENFPLEMGAGYFFRCVTSSTWTLRK